MSLVNDLLIEIDRQADENADSLRHRLDGIKPRRLHPSRRVGFAPVALFIGGSMLFAGAAILAFSDLTIPTFGTRLSEVRPAVSARRADELRIIRPESNQASPIDKRFEWTLPVITVESPATTTALPTPATPAPEGDQVALRPIAIQSISISQDAQTTRLRIMAEESAAYQIKESQDAFEFEVILEAASLESSISDLKLLGTPIRSIRAHSEGKDLRLALALDENVRIQSQWIWQEYGAVLLIDLQSSGRTGSETDRSMPSESLVNSFSKSSGLAIDLDMDLDNSSKAPGILGSYASPVNESERERPLRIARSEGDRHRDSQRALRDRANRILEAARVARTQGKIQEANALYESAIETMPGFREAILEWAALLANSNQVSEAVALIRDARTKSPNDSGLTMLHATIIAQVGDLESAIGILDQSKHNLTQAPDLHALAAAFLQQEGKHGLAIERYEALLRRYPSEARWWMGMGISLEALRRKAEALDVYRIAVQLGELPSKARQWVSSRVTVLGEEV